MQQSSHNRSAMFRALGGLRRGLVPKAWAQPFLAQGQGAQPGGLFSPAAISRNLHNVTPASGLSAMRAPAPPAMAISQICGAVTCASLGAYSATAALCDVSVFDVETGDETATCEASSVAKFSSWQDWAFIMYFFMILDLLRQLLPQLSHALGLMPFLRAMNSPHSVTQFTLIADLVLDILHIFRNNVAARLEFGGICRPASNPGAAAVSIDVRFDTCMGYSTISPELAELMLQNGAQAIPWQFELRDGTREIVKQKLALTIQLTFKGTKVVITNDFLVRPRERGGNAIAVYLSAGELSKAGLLTSSLAEVQRVLETED